MSEKSPKKLNRLGRRSIVAFQIALEELLEEKNFNKITVTDLANHSGLTRSTFYAHFATKEELLKSILDNVLDDFFELLKDFYGADASPNQVLESDIQYFRVWEENRHLLKVMDVENFRPLLVDRLRSFWDKLFFQNIRPSITNIGGNYSNYTLNYLACSFASFLIEWTINDMQPSAELMGEMLYHFTCPSVMLSARERFKDRFN